MASISSSESRQPGAKSRFAKLRRAVFGLQGKFTLVVAGIVLIVVGLGVAATQRITTSLISRIESQQCARMAALIANRVALEYERTDAAFESLAEQMIRNEPLVFVSFLDAQGRKLAASMRNLEDRSIEPITAGLTPGTTLGTPVAVASMGAKSAYLDVTYPVTRFESAGAGQEPVLLGYVRIGYSTERSMAAAAAALDVLAGIATVIVAMIVPLAFILVRLLSGPLNSLAKTMSCFAAGDMDARSPIRSRDEIGQLAETYNLMADTLAARHQEKLRLNAELERRVRQRTGQLRELASRDSLTGLYNRRHFNEVLMRHSAQTQRYGGQLSCIMVDLDDFKSVNDRFGHQLGDELLILTAITINKELRSSDLAARFGGDEFIILLPQTGVESACVLGERIRARFNKAIADQFPHCCVSLSIGVGSMSDVVATGGNALVRAADQALYEAKTQGKDTIAWSAPALA